MLKYVRIFLSFLADSSPFKARGFRSGTVRTDFYVFKEYGNLKLWFYQSLSPDHPHLSHLLDFSIEDGVFVLEFPEGGVANLVQEHDLYYAFERVERRENTWFLFDKRLDFGSAKNEEKLTLIEEFIQRYDSGEFSKI